MVAAGRRLPFVQRIRSGAFHRMPHQRRTVQVHAFAGTHLPTGTAGLSISVWIPYLYSNYFVPARSTDSMIGGSLISHSDTSVNAGTMSAALGARTVVEHQHQHSPAPRTHGGHEFMDSANIHHLEEWLSKREMEAPTFILRASPPREPLRLRSGKASPRPWQTECPPDRSLRCVSFSPSGLFAFAVWRIRDPWLETGTTAVHCVCLNYKRPGWVAVCKPTPLVPGWAECHLQQFTACVSA
jgi:hypothetical protein